MSERKILRIRGEKVMLDSDLAELYEVPREGLNVQVMSCVKGTDIKKTKCYDISMKYFHSE